LPRFLLVLAAMLLFNCATWKPIPREGAGGAPDSALVQADNALAPVDVPGVLSAPAEAGRAGADGAEALPVVPTLSILAQGSEQPARWVEEPAGCLSDAEQAALADSADMLAYASRLLDQSETAIGAPLSDRLLPDTWQAYTGRFTWDEFGILSLTVNNIENKFLVQRIMHALQAAGFVTWLRETPDQGLHILAIPLRDPSLRNSGWAPYLEAYWRSPSSVPDGDGAILPTLKLPPCAWMVERGFAPPLDSSWWADEGSPDWPDYAAAAQAFLAADTQAAAHVAGEIDWLGQRFPEGPDTMCGPLAWSILQRAGAFPPDWGAWQAGPKSFWLAKPEKNGRPWSLFPRSLYRVTTFRQPLGTFDFREFPLYPGDFLYTYSARDGFDHMLVVTEVDAQGNVFTVSNLIQVEPVRQTTIERVLFLNLYDLQQGIARNQWARDTINGRTGHAGFEVFRWRWAEKDISGSPARYAVLPGDTPGLIAARWKTPAAWIAEYNGITVETQLKVGQVLQIPPRVSAGR
jgi:hypothetical protein